MVPAPNPQPAWAREPYLSLRHHDPSQLWFQLDEVVGERVYLRDGVQLEPGATVLDVGANVGVAATFFAADCEAGAVHSFEPIGPNYELLRANVAAHPACVTYPFGLADRPGSAEFTYYPGAAAMSGLYAEPERDRELVRRALSNAGSSAEQAERQVAGRYEPETLRGELRTLAQVVREEGIERIDLLKIDVERAELDVLRGLDEQAWERCEQLVVEAHGAERVAEISALLGEQGYRVRRAQEEIMRGTDLHMLYATR